MDNTGDGTRGESKSERADRRWVELLQEVRVAQTGVQIMLAFLLTVAFTPRFVELSSADRNIYVATIVLGAAATAALIAPVPLHRAVTGQRMKPRAVTWTSRLTVTGLMLLLCTIVCAMLLILRFVLNDALAGWIVVGVLAWFVACWVLLPAWVRRTG
ncbi:DUF6328 family protein [Streptomyces sp. NPDC002889]|uniref:DUF6328 family protein n=1 Tax=Streptomyces sp. NPDC002889 TaxID=3364669 RepID=UPI0036BCDE55